MEDFPGVGKLGLCFPDLAVSWGGFVCLVAGSFLTRYQPVSLPLLGMVDWEVRTTRIRGAIFVLL